MVYIDATDESIDSHVKRICAPLFATDLFLQEGHDESVTSATVTFVKFESRVYAVTCHHVLSAFFTAAVYGQRRLVPSIQSGHAIHQFGSIGIEGKLKWAFQSCREFPDSTDIGDPKALTALDRKNADKADIAIADLTESWSILSMQRGADAIDLDSWKEPEWPTAQTVWMAYGFPNNTSSELAIRLLHQCLESQ